MKYTFEIGAYSPEKIPMSRLAEYLADLANLLGEKNAVHFENLTPGSTRVNVLVEKEAVPKVTQRLRRCGTEEAPDDLASAYKSLDKKLAEDNASGRLVTPMKEGELPTNVIIFPGITRPKPLDYGVVRQQGFLDGVIVSIGGRDTTAHIQLQDGEIVHTRIESNREIAKQLAPYIWGPTVRVYGEGRWERSENGEWALLKFRVRNHEVLPSETLSETLDELRSVPGSEWKELESPLEYLRQIRE